MIYSLFDYSDRVAGEQKSTFIDLPYIHTLCDALEQCVMGELPEGKRNLLITIPPRHYKTTFISQNFVAWSLAEVAPDCEFILTSYAAELATSNNLAVKRILQQPWHQELYPHLTIAKNEKDLQKYFRTTAGGSVYATGMEGSVTGFGAGKTRKGFGGAIIIDDPLKASDAKSAVMLENCVRYYQGTLKSRRNAVRTPIIIIMQRLHVDDLAGWVLKNEPESWHHVMFPAVQNGAVLNPVTTSVEDLEEMKVVDPVTYYAQYQQTPIVPGGNIIKLNWWRVYDPAEYKHSGLRYITADTGFKEREVNDQSVLQCWDATEEGLFFIDSMYGRWGFPTLMRNAQQFYNIFNAVGSEVREFWVEDKASGTPLVQMMEELRLPVFPWKPADYGYPDDKVGRMQASSWVVHGGKVWLPKGNVPVRVDENTVVYVTAGAAALMEEAATFSRDMSHKHDDHCDAFTMAVSLYRDAGGKST